jgi:hypothetical protein
VSANMPSGPRSPSPPSRCCGMPAVSNAAAGCPRANPRQRLRCDVRHAPAAEHQERVVVQARARAIPASAATRRPAWLISCSNPA